MLSTMRLPTPVRRFRSRTWLTGGLTFAVAAAVMAVSATSTEAASRPGRYPGLPFAECTPRSYNAQFCDIAGPNTDDDNSWLNFAQSAVAGSVPAKQWARLPVTLLATNVVQNVTADSDRPCFGDPQLPCTYTQLAETPVKAYFVSPAASAENYGYSQVLRVKSLAFGSIPVSIGLQVRQGRDDNNLPIPLTTTVREVTDYPASGYPPDTYFYSLPALQLNQDVSVAVTDLQVDGVSVDVRGCSTPSTARLTLESRGIKVLNTSSSYYPTDRFDQNDFEKGFAITQGGTLKGSLSIPQFQNCGSEDIGRLVSSVVSGPNNPVTARLGQGCTDAAGDAASRPAAPGQDTFKKYSQECDPAYVDLSNPTVSRTPREIPFPTQAPRPVE